MVCGSSFTEPKRCCQLAGSNYRYFLDTFSDIQESKLKSHICEQPANCSSKKSGHSSRKHRLDQYRWSMMNNSDDQWWTILTSKNLCCYLPIDPVRLDQWYESQGASCGQKRSKIGSWPEFGRCSAFAWDLGWLPLLLSPETFTSRSLELCLSETVGWSVGSAREPVKRVVELISHSDQSVLQVNWSSWKVSLFWKSKKKSRLCSVGRLIRKVEAERCQGGDSRSSSFCFAQNPSIAIDIASSSCCRTQCSQVNWSS